MPTTTDVQPCKVPLLEADPVASVTPLELRGTSIDRLRPWDAGYVTTMADAHSGADGPSPEDPTRFPEEPEIAPLDETPDGRTPSDPGESSDDSLPPGTG